MNTHSSELYASLSASTVESNSKDFETLSLRIPHRTAAMVQALVVASQKPVLTLFTKGISLQLAESLLSSVDNEPLISEEASKGVQAGSALDILVSTGAIKHDKEMIRSVHRILKKQKT